MCVTHELLRRVPYQAYSLTEDLEFGIDLAWPATGSLMPMRRTPTPRW